MLSTSLQSSKIKSYLKRNLNAPWQSDTAQADSDDTSLFPAVRSMNCAGTECYLCPAVAWQKLLFLKSRRLLLRKNSFAEIKALETLECLFLLNFKKINKAAETASFTFFPLTSLPLLKKDAGKLLYNTILTHLNICIHSVDVHKISRLQKQLMCKYLKFAELMAIAYPS